MKTKKYKLIKEYPGSPKLGTIITETNGWGRTWKEANNYPEFWEKVIEKDYQILSFKQNSLVEDLWTEFAHGWCRNSNGGPVTEPYSYDEILNNHLNGGIKYSINSVKRLSDGEVFAVGDKIILNKSRNKREIHSFILSGGSILICDTISIRNAMWCLSDISKYKPLFTTEDGVDIYEGDKYFELALTFEPQFREAIYECTGRPNINYDYNTLKGKKKLNEVGRYYFSTKEAAEKYVLMNRPCLSINELVVNGILGQDEFISTERLKEIVKQKIK